jgi:GDPmannose 4,6-dehydratase
VIATGVTTEVREFVRMSFNELGIAVDFKGKGIDEKGIIASIDHAAFQAATGMDLAEVKTCQVGQEVVAIDARYFRPTEVDLLIGDPSKANRQLGWQPKYDLPALVGEMVASDLAAFKKEKILRDHGFDILQQYE